MISGFEGDLSGLLSYQAHYNRLKKIYGDDVLDTVAGTVMTTIDNEVESALKQIEISGFYDVLSIEFTSWRFIPKR